MSHYGVSMSVVASGTESGSDERGYTSFFFCVSEAASDATSNLSGWL